MDVTEYGRILSDTVKEMDDLSGVIVFTDLFLASPYNQAVWGYRNIGKDDKYYVVSGVNLPMLIEAVNLRAMGKDISEIVAEACLLYTSGAGDSASSGPLQAHDGYHQKQPDFFHSSEFSGHCPGHHRPHGTHNRSSGA